jgi:hypothetical protein
MSPEKMPVELARDMLFSAALDFWPDLKPREFRAAALAVIERAGPGERMITLNEMSDRLFEELKLRRGEPVR